MKSWFAGTASSVNSEIITPFSNAEQIIYKYNQAIAHNSLTQQGWQRLIAQCDDGLASYLTNIKGSTASMSAYSVSLQGNITGYTKITQAMKQYNALGAVSQKEQQNFATAVSLTNTKLGSYLTGLNGAKASLSGYGVSLIASTAKTVGLTIATTALNAALTFGISAIITGVVSAFATWINSSKKITEAAEEAKDKISSINDDLKTNTETVENAKQRYAELAQEVENLGKVNQSRGSLSTDEYKEFLDLSNQLAGVFPQLSKNYDENGNAILDLSGSVDTIVGSLDNLLQKEKDLANQKIMDEFPDVYKGYIKDLGDAQAEAQNEQIKDYQFTLYSQDKILLTSSKVFYSSTLSSYTFYSLQNNTKYYVRACGETINGMQMDTGYVAINIQYERIPANIGFYIQNIYDKGYISIETNILSIGYETENDNYKFVDGCLILKNNSLTYNEGFEITGDFSLFIEAKKLPISKFFTVGDGSLSLNIVKICNTYYCRLFVKDSSLVMCTALPKARITTNNGEYIITEDGKTIEIINTSYDDNELVVFELKRVKGIYSLNAYYKQERMVANA